MKARRLVLCLFLSLALIVTFIPLTTYATEGNSHAITFNDTTSITYLHEEGVYCVNLTHGNAVPSEGYDPSSGCFYMGEGNSFWFQVSCDTGWTVDNVQYSIDGGISKIDAETNGGGGWWMTMPEDKGDYAVNIYVSFVVGDDDDNDLGYDIFSPFDEIVDSAEQIVVGAEKEVDEEGIFKFEPKTSGVYAFYSSCDEDVYPDPIGCVLDAGGSVIAENDDYDNSDFKVYFGAEKGKVYYLQALDSRTGYSIFHVGLEEVSTNISGIEFVPIELREDWNNCIWDESYWGGTQYFDVGDKLIIKYKDGSSKTYIYKRYGFGGDGEIEEFIDEQEGSSLPGDVYWNVSDARVPLSAHKAGEIITKKVDVSWMGMKSSKTIKVQLLLSHDWDMEMDMIRTAALPATCTKAGNIEYWQCNYCKRYFKDKDGINEIAAGSWVVPASHRFNHVKNAAGLLKNGSEYDQCSVCGLVQNKMILPGYSKNFVKTPKVKAGKKSFTITWKKQPKAAQKKFNGYQIRYSLKKNMAKAKMVKAGKGTKGKTIKSLKSKKKYFVQVRTYTKKSGKLFYSKWSAKKTVKTK